jgi:hypothetical protein
MVESPSRIGTAATAVIPSSRAAAAYRQRDPAAGQAQNRSDALHEVRQDPFDVVGAGKSLGKVRQDVKTETLRLRGPVIGQPVVGIRTSIVTSNDYNRRAAPHPGSELK